MPTLDENVAAIKKDLDGFGRLTNSISEAATVSPDAYAKQVELSRAINVSPDSLPEYEPAAKALQLTTSLDLPRVWKDSPKTAEWLSTPINAKIASDSVHELTGIESLFKSLSEAPHNISDQWTAGRLQSEQGLLGYKVAEGTATPEELRRINVINARVRALKGADTWLGSAASIAGQMSYTLPDALSFGVKAGAVTGGTALAAGQLGPQIALPEELVTVPAAAIAGFTAGTATRMTEQIYRMEAGQSYIEQLTAGIAEPVARAGAVGVGLVNAGLEMIGLGFVAKPFAKVFQRKAASELTRLTTGQIVSRAAGAYAGSVAGETATEVAQEVTAIFAEEAGKKASGQNSLFETDEGREQIADRLVSIASQVGKGMAILGVPGAAVSFTSDYARVRQSKTDQQFIDGLGKAAETSKLRPRSDSAFENFVMAQAEGGPVENIYIDGSAFSAALRQLSPEGVTEFAEKNPDIARQINEAEQVGGDVEIPIGKYAATIAGTDLGRAMQQHVRVNPERLSMAELKEAEKLAQDMKSEKQADVLGPVAAENKPKTRAQIFAKQTKAIRDDVLGQLKLSGKYTLEERRTGAKLLQDFVSTLAARSGTMPEEIWGKYRNTILAHGGISSDAIVEPVTVEDVARKVAKGEELTAEDRSVAESKVQDVQSRVDEMANEPDVIEPALSEAKPLPGGAYAVVESEPVSLPIEAAPQSQVPDGGKTAGLAAQGNKTPIIAGGKNYGTATYRLVEKADIVASHDPVTFTENPAYPQERQNRDYSNRETKVQAIQASEGIASNNFLTLLQPSAESDTGMPVLNTDGVVLSGNNRTFSILRNYDKYRIALAMADLRMFGLDQQALSGMSEPVLVREFSDKAKEAEFIISSNEQKVKTLTVAEIRKHFAALSPEMKSMARKAIGGIYREFNESDVANVKTYLDNLNVFDLPTIVRQSLLDSKVLAGADIQNGKLTSVGADKVKMLAATLLNDDMGVPDAALDYLSADKQRNGNLDVKFDKATGGLFALKESDSDAYRDEAKDIGAALVRYIEYINNPELYKADTRAMSMDKLARGASVTQEALTANQALYLEALASSTQSSFAKVVESKVMKQESLFNQREVLRQLNTPANLPATINIDGVNRPTTNSEGRQIHQTEAGVRNFWRWFGDSKVADAEGRPLVVYHGTSESFDSFSTEKVGSSFGKDEIGFFFTGSAMKAARYADTESVYALNAISVTRDPVAGSNTMPVYLSIKNPLTLDKYTDAYYTNPDVEVGDSGISVTDYYDDNTASIIEMAKQEGHDGVLFSYKGDVLSVAFEPTQIKSATGNTGEFGGDPNILRQLSGKWYYSALQRASEGAKQDAMPGSQWAQWLSGNASKLGVKSDEIRWSGLGDWLMTRGKEKVSKSEIIDFLQQNGVQVEEVMKGERPPEPTVSFEDGKWVVRSGTGKVFGRYSSESDALAAKPRAVEYFLKPTKYESYVLPGGENYRELLLTLPDNRRKPTFEEWWNKTHIGDIPESGKMRVIAEERYKKEVDNMPLEGGFRSSHWDEPNILAHIRFNDRTDADGKRVLFIEEIQSDWGQTGKKEGFVVPDEKLVAKQVDGYWEIRTEGGRFVTNVTDKTSESEAIAEAKRRMDKEPRRTLEGAPSAPFVTETKSWVSLALKRMIRYAAENGYDKVAFVNGEQSAERYDLSKKVDSIPWEKNDDGTYNLRAYHGDTWSGIGNDIPADKLQDYIGKEPAKRILESKESDGELSGVDLKVGGEGMKAFYDKIVPQVASGIVKKYGANIEKQNFIGNHRVLKRGNEYQVWSDRYLISHGETEQEALSKAFANQNGFTITPKMREAAMSGFPLFQSGGVRGGFDPSAFTTMLGEKADFSTFVHETGHYFLSVYADIAAQEGADAGIRADMDAVLEWFGIDGATPDERLSVWRSMSLEEQRKYHEQWAYNFELYMAEGKAPTTKLKKLFEKFKDFIKKVYKSIRDEVNASYREETGEDLPILTGEVRHVMERMLASEQDISDTEEALAMVPLFKEKPDGASDDDWQAYQAHYAESREEAIAALERSSLKAMRWLSGAKSRLLKEIQDEEKETRDAIRIEEAQKVSVMPVYRAITELSIREVGALRINAEDVRRFAGDNYDKVKKYTAKDGVDADFVADMFGFESGDAFIKALVVAKPKKELIEEMTDARMVAEHDEMVDPKKLQQRVDEALHNEARTRFVAAELRFLEKAGRSERVLAMSAKMAADETIGAIPVKKLRPDRYVQAESRAAKAALSAMKKGDSQGVISAKRNQLLQNALAKKALEAVRQRDKDLKYLKKFGKEASRKAVGADAIDQIDGFLERFGLMPPTPNVERQSFSQWVASLSENDNIDPDIDERFENESYRTPWEEMTVLEFSELMDAIRQIEAIGRDERYAYTQAKAVEIKTIKQSLLDGLLSNSAHRTAKDTRMPSTWDEKAKSSAKAFGWAHAKASTIARLFDGDKDGGAWWEYLIRPANSAGDRETSMRAEFTEKAAKILKPYLDGGKMHKKGKVDEIPGTGMAMTREQKLVAALYTGTDVRLQRLMDGEGWSQKTVNNLLKSFTSKELETIQGIWDLFAEFRPQVDAMERKIYGKRLNDDPPRAFKITSADGVEVDMRGGYFPLKYDAYAGMTAGQLEKDAAVRAQMSSRRKSGVLKKSFTKALGKRGLGKLSLDLSTLYNGIDDEIHYLSWTEWLIDAKRLMRSHRIDTAIRELYGKEVKDQIDNWINDIATGDRVMMDTSSKAVSWMTRNISASALTFNAITGAIQITGLVNSIPRIGAKYLGKGLKSMTSPKEAYENALRKSSFMAGRDRTQWKELSDLKNIVRGQSKTEEFKNKYGYILITKIQQMVDVVVWNGAEMKALDEFGDPAKAIAIADQAVIDTQGSGMLKDRSAIERDKAGRVFTIFYSYMNSVLNLNIANGMSARRAGEKIAMFMLINMVPVVIETILRDALVPDVGGDDEPYYEKIAKRYVENQMQYLLGQVVFVRELQQVVPMATGGNAFGYSGPAGLRMIPDAINLGVQVSQMEADIALLRATVTLAGDLTGLPSVEINRIIKGIDALAEDETDNPLAVPFGTER